MNEKIPCEMIEDLLPLYLDGLTHETTAGEIEGHLKQCSRCRESYEGMKAAIGTEQVRKKAEACREIDYLKAVKKKNAKHVMAGIAAAVLVIAAVLGVKLFIIGSPSESYMITYLEGDQEEIRVGGTFFGSAAVYAGHKLVKEADGSQKLVVYACLASAWNRNGVFNLTLNRKGVEEELRINGAVVTKEGFIISPLAGRLYEAKNPYVGDASADGRLAEALGIARHMGSFKNELQTAQEPYGWTLVFEDSVRNSAVFDDRMKDYGCVLLALTDNLGQVTWIYTVEAEEGAIERRRTLTDQEASDYLKAPVKSFGESSRSVQELLELVNLLELAK